MSDVSEPPARHDQPVEGSRDTVEQAEREKTDAEQAPVEEHPETQADG
jgi:hypothetical protein